MLGRFVAYHAPAIGQGHMIAMTGTIHPLIFRISKTR